MKSAAEVKAEIREILQDRAHCRDLLRQIRDGDRVHRRELREAEAGLPRLHMELTAAHSLAGSYRPEWRRELETALSAREGARLRAATALAELEEFSGEIKRYMAFLEEKLRKLRSAPRTRRG